MKTVLFSSSDFFIENIYDALSGSGHELIAVVCRKISPALSGILTSAGVKVMLDTGQSDSELYDPLRSLQADIFTVVSFGRIFSGEFFTLTRLGAVNVHFSMLPAYRGAAPVEWAVYNGEKKTGITVFNIVEKLDSGDIILQREFKIGRGETARELKERLSAEAPGMLLEALDLIVKKGFNPRPQKGVASYAPSLKKELGSVDFKTDSADDIARKVAAFSHMINIYTFFRGHRLILKSVEPVSAGDNAEPGRIFEIIKGEGFKVGCGSGALFIKKVQPSGKREMSAWEFAIGRRLRLGDTL